MGMCVGVSIDGKIHRGGECCGGHVVDGDNNVVVVGGFGLRVEGDDVRGDLIVVYNML